MVNDIIAAITTKLGAVFGIGYEIYTQGAEQGLGDRCFFVTSLKTLQGTLLGRRKLRTYPFNIAYVASHGDTDRREVADKLIDEMEFIMLADGGGMHGTGISAEIVDGVLQFLVNYNTIVYTASNDSAELMSNVSINMKG